MSFVAVLSFGLCELVFFLSDRATEQMAAYDPAEHAQTANVAPLFQFFELVHIGDTIQSMVQVYFDKEVCEDHRRPLFFSVPFLLPSVLFFAQVFSRLTQAEHVDRTDVFSVVMREKKRFENVLDDCVAAGLNAGTHALMNQVSGFKFFLFPSYEKN